MFMIKLYPQVDDIMLNSVNMAKNETPKKGR